MNGNAEKRIEIQGPVELEARLYRRSGEAGLVITHPHPLYGGSMDNNVVEALVRAGQAAGMSTLRFNFRGVGMSGGSHGRGIAERDDLRVALDHLAGEGLTRLYAAGYSFGAWVAATTDLSGLPVKGTVWIAPPVGMMPLNSKEVTHPPDLIVYGEMDAFCPAGPVAALADSLGPGVELTNLPGVDHFFGGSEEELVRLVSWSLARLGRAG